MTFTKEITRINCFSALAQSSTLIYSILLARLFGAFFILASKLILTSINKRTSIGFLQFL